MSEDKISKIWPNWKIEKQLGKGSYGVVYEASHEESGVTSNAAIKVISIPQSQEEIDSLRSEDMDEAASKAYFDAIKNDFVKEIQIMQSLKSAPNVVFIEDYAVKQKEEGMGWDIFIRMEQLTPFSTYLREHRMTEREIIKLGCDICSALEVCNQKNVIHRDIKPENIFINEFGIYKLGDFGIARSLGNLSGSMSQKGTQNYIAPEILLKKNYDARVDIYSLGIVLYRLLNKNRMPFIDSEEKQRNPLAREDALSRRLRGEPLPPPCDASPEMANLILRACSYYEKDRFADATEMKNALQEVANGTYEMSPLVLLPEQNPEEPEEDRTMIVRRGADAPSTVHATNDNKFGVKKEKKSGKRAVILAIVAAVVLLLGGIALIVGLQPKETDSSSVSDEGKELADDADVTEIPVGTATPTVTPMQTPTEIPEPTSINTPVPTATVTPEPTATNTPVPTPTVTPEPTATNTPVPTPTATPTPTPTSTPTPKPTATPTPKPTATPTPKPTATPTPTPTSTPTPTPTPAMQDYVMDWKDENLEKAMREVTGIDDREIMYSDVKNIKDLYLYYGEISDISALSELTNLQVLYLNNNEISDISALSGLTNLTQLFLDNNEISDISALSGLTNLKYLWIGANEISDISALSGLTNLTQLALSNNEISDISALSGLTNLTYLWMDNNEISDVNALSGLNNLQMVYLTGNPITDYSPVEFVPELIK